MMTIEACQALAELREYIAGAVADDAQRARWSTAIDEAMTDDAVRRAEAPVDPMDWPLPCDVRVGHGVMRRGVRLGTLVARMKVLYEMGTGHSADAVAARTDAERADLFARFVADLRAGRRDAAEAAPAMSRLRGMASMPANATAESIVETSRQAWAPPADDAGAQASTPAHVRTGYTHAAGIVNAEGSEADAPRPAPGLAFDERGVLRPIAPAGAAARDEHRAHERLAAAVGLPASVDAVAAMHVAAARIARLEAQLAAQEWMPAHAAYFAPTFDVWRDDDMLARSTGQRDRALAEAMQTADGARGRRPVRVFEVHRVLVAELPGTQS